MTQGSTRGTAPAYEKSAIFLIMCWIVLCLSQRFVSSGASIMTNVARFNSNQPTRQGPAADSVDCDNSNTLTPIICQKVRYRCGRARGDISSSVFRVKSHRCLSWSRAVASVSFSECRSVGHDLRRMLVTT
ncbi:hypothetical protein EV424DRAFT_47358 [Suillus variegatus]|nr:hypothetical protein EV424DRAFT_47358 [Suillus variegatus]